jgi:nitroreductase
MCWLGLIMELDVCIKGRRSVRSYTDEPVSKEQVEAVLEAGVWGSNRHVEGAVEVHSYRK